MQIFIHVYQHKRDKEIFAENAATSWEEAMRNLLLHYTPSKHAYLHTQIVDVGKATMWCEDWEDAARLASDAYCYNSLESIGIEHIEELAAHCQKITNFGNKNRVAVFEAERRSKTGCLYTTSTSTQVSA